MKKVCLGLKKVEKHWTRSFQQNTHNNCLYYDANDVAMAAHNVVETSYVSL